MYEILVKGKYMQSSTHFLQKVSASREEQTSPRRILVLFYIRGDARIGLIKSSPENIYLKTWSASFSQSTEGLLPDCHPELLSGGWRSAAAAAQDLILVDVDDKCQSVVGNSKNLSTHIHSSICPNRQKVETAQTSISGQMGKLSIVCPYNGTLLSCKKERGLTHIQRGWTWKTWRSGKKPDPKGTWYVILFTWNRQIQRDGEQISGYQGLGSDR